MIYLVSYTVNTSPSRAGHKHIELNQWSSAQDTVYVMECLASINECTIDDVMITSVFKLDTPSEGSK
jgi:hypothetical protein